MNINKTIDCVSFEKNIHTDSFQNDENHQRLKKSLASLEKGNIIQKSLSELETIAKT